MRHILGLTLGLLPALAGAASLDVEPVRVTFTAQNTIAVLTLSNAGDAPSTVQLEPVAWSQDKGEDVYTPTHDLLATPPIFTVPPHAKQIIRVGLRVAPDPKQEKAYRLYLQEVPAPDQVKGLGVVMALRIGVPAFVEPRVPPKTELQWSARRVSDKELDLSVTNTGDGHVQVHGISLTGPGGSPPLELQQAAYILPGKSRSWVLNLQTRAPSAGVALQLKCDTDLGPMNAQVVVQ